MTERVRFSEFWFLYNQTIRQMGRFVLWLPLLIYGLLALALALIHYYIFSPVAGPIISLWTNLIKPSLAGAYFHYPLQFEFFPFYFGYGRLLLSAVVEAFLFGIFIDLLIAIYRGQKPAFLRSVGLALRRYFFLTISWLVVIAILYLVNQYFYDFIEKILGFAMRGSPRRQIGAGAILRVLTVVIYMPFIYLLPSIIRGEASIGKVLSRAFALFGRHPFISFGIVLIPYVIGFIPNWIFSQSTTIVENFSPELVFYLGVVTIILDILLNFIFVGAAVKFFMDRQEE